MKITDSQRLLMAHSALDLAEIQEVKRVWWNLQNVRQVFTDAFEPEAISIVLKDLESIAEYAAQQ